MATFWNTGSECMSLFSADSLPGEGQPHVNHCIPPEITSVIVLAPPPQWCSALDALVACKPSPFPSIARIWQRGHPATNLIRTGLIQMSKNTSNETERIPIDHMLWQATAYSGRAAASHASPDQRHQHQHSLCVQPSLSRVTLLREDGFPLSGGLMTSIQRLWCQDWHYPEAL